MLENGSFDGAWVEQGGISQLKVFVPWVLWWDEEPGKGNIDRPEAAPIGEAFDETTRRRSPPTAQKIWHNDASWRGGLYQRVAVPTDRYCTFAIWYRQDVPNPSGKWLGYCKVGIDPTGGTDPHSPDVVWCEDVWDNYATFLPLTIGAVSQADHVTVFTFTHYKWALDWNDVYWDDAELTVEGEAPPGGGVTEARVIELASQVAAAEFQTRIGAAMRKLAALIANEWKA